ncbi:MAG TPA: F0F1 ATP synthase subunit B [Bacteroidales bacterium]|jgi:F-type H+-transporting ATPase subunit b|nr:MAG: ATP synthase subunit b [Bacteroidetes bacterium ADurb.BinA012]HNY58149.1 F0F1 ATP synthase subunit B [Bacteroidales bacterium]HOH15481.1 F0F1 ATP synthase subunit B [Bacteroidales bacterium]HPV25614.1 F0F1 ATP synthase subunit B [Bacteroidales bacterium]HQB51675.1 F0F1 ATP synthase subunit B [Bacteroidales bacterium]
MLLQSSLASPAIGTIFWTTLIFLLLLVLLWKFAWGPIMKAVKTREDMIKNSLESAEKAREEMKVLQADNEMILQKAREERDKILRDARVAYDRMMAEAREKGQSESDSLVRRARELIEREKVTAIAEVKKEVARLAIEVASKVVGETLKSDAEQQKLIERYINEIEANRN